MARQKRKGISVKTRFEVFKRDKFTCQYCGRSAPDIVLEIDHIKPVSKGGDDGLLNFITSCKECNAGKSNRELADDSIIKAQKEQLDVLEERRQQMKMMLDWQRELAEQEATLANGICDLWDDIIAPFHLSDSGRAQIKKTLRKFGVDETANAMRISAGQYLDFEADGKPKMESALLAFGKIQAICVVRRLDKEKPYMRDLYYVRGILRNRLPEVPQEAITVLENAYIDGVDVEAMKDEAKHANTWGGFMYRLRDLSGGPL